jgi:hypothetical protein
VTLVLLLPAHSVSSSAQADDPVSTTKDAIGTLALAIVRRLLDARFGGHDTVISL